MEEFEANDMKVLGAVKRGANNVRFLKNIVNLNKDELVKILDILDESHMIKSEYVMGLLGQKKLNIQITENGTKKIWLLSISESVEKPTKIPVWLARPVFPVRNSLSVTRIGRVTIMRLVN